MAFMPAGERPNNFYPRPPRGGRPTRCASTPMATDFYPRPPRGGRPRLHTMMIIYHTISIHALREEGDVDAGLLENLLQISIHALREEGDLRCWGHAACLFISIHALREEGDPFCPVRPEGRWRFLSTPSARRATPLAAPFLGRKSISIHALREEGDAPWSLSGSWNKISIHALREEGDEAAPGWDVWGNISIHALREEGDRSRQTC